MLFSWKASYEKSKKSYKRQQKDQRNVQHEVWSSQLQAKRWEKNVVAQ